MAPKPQRCVNWKPQEDEALCKWARVRSPQAIASRFKIINQQCSLWKTCMTKANVRHVSGSNLEDVDMNTKTLFLNDKKPPNRPFKFGNTVNLEEDEDDVVMPTPRPLGRDNQKNENKKGKCVESYLNQSGKFLSELVQQGNEANEDRRRKLELL
ncbi:unnamed protein product [Prunus armeniaca]